ncbi:MAG TPA: pyridoxal-dependent decarboxylase [Acetobacteraceae bacterium]|nr:pyridoxal-dependent decarboxylase [Acetobacteraceae bacterium]
MTRNDQTSVGKSALFPMPEDRTRIDDLLTRQLRDANDRVVAGHVSPTIDLAEFKKELTAFDFGQPRLSEDTLAWIIARLEDGITHITNPRYFGLFNPAPTFPAQCADRIAAVFNPQLATSTTSPVPVALEAHVIRAIAQRAGFPETASGHFTTGGAEANYTALICALTRACPGFALDGARAFSGNPKFYISRESHLAWLKIAHQAGIGRSAVRLVATDGTGRMSVAALQAAIAEDLVNGQVPVMIVATAGTTNAGMIDPLAACGEIAREHGAWFHADAAWGGAVIASDRLRGLLAGIEAADSMTIDAHKWFATTMGCGMFITRDPGLLSSAFQVSTTYMPSNLKSLDPYVTSMQWSRRFLGLRLFLSLAAAGWAGYGEHIEHSVELAASLAHALRSLGWTVVNDSQLAVLCIQPPSGSSDVGSIVSKVLQSGRAWISTATFEGQAVIRACLTHGETTQHDVDQLVDALRAAQYGRA